MTDRTAYQVRKNWDQTAGVYVAKIDGVLWGRSTDPDGEWYVLGEDNHLRQMLEMGIWYAPYPTSGIPMPE
jgi:hypothetical protein